MTDQIVEWYRAQGISPVRQDISDRERHFFRRQALYRQLGLLPMTVEGRRVLEVGPGSGFNSIYTASLKPSRYVLLEGNPTGVRDIQRLFADSPDAVEVVPKLLQEYPPGDLFDVVLCEGMLSGVPDPENVARLLAAHVRPGGILVLTCIDQISYFSETLRRLCAQLLVTGQESLDEQVRLMLPAVAPHLAKLEGMSRSHEDWIIDSLINPASIGPLLAIPVALETLADHFDFYGCSPDFCSDWRWYKQIVPGEALYNERACEQYWALAHNFLDHRELMGARPVEKNRALFAACERTRAQVRSWEKHREQALLVELCQNIREASKLTAEFSPRAAAAMEEVAVWVEKADRCPETIGHSREFSGFFGRGQQYLSLTRR